MNYDYVTVIGDLNIDNDGHTDRHRFLSNMCDVFNLEGGIAWWIAHWLTNMDIPGSNPSRST